MITKRTALSAILAGTFSKFTWDDARAAEPKDSNTIYQFNNTPVAWVIDLRQMSELIIRHDGGEIVFTPAELFATLKG